MPCAVRLHGQDNWEYLQSIDIIEDAQQLTTMTLDGSVRAGVSTNQRSILTLDWFQVEAPSVQMWLSSHQPFELSIETNDYEEYRHIEGYSVQTLQVNVGNRSGPEMQAIIELGQPWQSIPLDGPTPHTTAPVVRMPRGRRRIEL